MERLNVTFVPSKVYKYLRKVSKVPYSKERSLCIFWISTTQSRKLNKWRQGNTIIIKIFQGPTEVVFNVIVWVRSQVYRHTHDLLIKT